MLMAVTMAMPMVMMARAVVGMLGVMRCLRDLIEMLVVDCPCLLTRPCLRNLLGMLAVECLCLLYFDDLDYLVLTRFSVWLGTRHVGLLTSDSALRTS